MDAPCKIQGSIHVFRLVNNMCPGKWVHITYDATLFLYPVSIYNYFVTTLRSTGILASTASPLITF